MVASDAVIPIARTDLSGNELEYVTDAVKSGWLTHRGKYEPLFEAALSQYLGKTTIATSSGTAALHLALLALGIGPGDEVIVPDLTFAAPASAVLAVGAKPVLVDVRFDQPTIDWSKVKVTSRTKAIIPVHLFGEDAVVQAPHLIELENRFTKAFREIPIIEDSCEAFGYVKPRGTFACFSFYGNKVITTGEGGALCGNSLELARKYRDGGFDSTYFHDTPGLNMRMTNMQAAVGLAQLERITTIVNNRDKILEIYKPLGGWGKWLKVIKGGPELREHLQAHGIESRPMFYPLHRMPPYKNQHDFFPNSDWWWKNTICLPVTVTEDEARYIVEKVCDGTTVG